MTPACLSAHQVLQDHIVALAVGLAVAEAPQWNSRPGCGQLRAAWALSPRNGQDALQIPSKKT